MTIYSSMYREEKADGSKSGVKWTCPNIHDLVRILDKVKVDLILENVFDKRLTNLEKLTVTQLREECFSHNLDKKGTKIDLVRRLKVILGEDAQVKILE